MISCLGHLLPEDVNSYMNYGSTMWFSSSLTELWLDHVVQLRGDQLLKNQVFAQKKKTRQVKLNNSMGPDGANVYHTEEPYFGLDTSPSTHLKASI